MRDANWIEGEWCAAESGDAFEVVLRRTDARSRDLWPRSGVPDLERALEGIACGVGAWRGAGRRARVEALARVLDRWQDDTLDLDRLTADLGFEEGELDDHLEEALLAGDDCLATPEPPGAPSTDGRGLLLRVPAGEFLVGLVRHAFPALLAGRAVLFLSDPDLPQLARDFVAQLVREERLAGCIALLHEDRTRCLAAALDSGAFAQAHVPGFGRAAAGSSTRVESGPLTNSGHVVLGGDDPLAAAQLVYERAFGAVHALSGQRAGQVGRVLCHERNVSAFTEALLARLEEERGRHACPVFTSGLGGHCGDLRRLGLDEGATLISAGSEDPLGFREELKRGILAPSVFTNVEPTMGVARASRPAPVLALLRAQSDAEARALLGKTAARRAPAPAAGRAESRTNPMPDAHVD
jgi:acyl-CoA reductase-like NAD-dependent aldehyde dehydrogenase